MELTDKQKSYILYAAGALFVVGYFAYDQMSLKAKLQKPVPAVVASATASPSPSGSPKAGTNQVVNTQSPSPPPGLVLPDASSLVVPVDYPKASSTPRPQHHSPVATSTPSSTGGSGGGGSSGGGSSGGGSGGGAAAPGAAVVGGTNGTTGTNAGTVGTNNSAALNNVIGTYWIDDTSLRHNPTCVKYKNVPGHLGTTADGIPCPICGG